jgi:hypothetical protein
VRDGFDSQLLILDDGVMLGTVFNFPARRL